jgi:osmotically-inducible protein OsmY
MEANEILCHDCGITLRPFMKVCPRCGAVRAGAVELELAPVVKPELPVVVKPEPPVAVERPAAIYLSPADTERRFPRFTSAQLTLMVIGILLLILGGVIAWLLWRQQVREQQQFNLPAAPAVGSVSATPELPVASPPPLTEDQQLEESVRATLAAYNPFGYTRYRYRIAQGVVTIEGEADHQPEKDGAGNVLRLVSGVREVVNRLTVKSEPGEAPLRVNDAEARVLEAALKRHLEAQEQSQSASIDSPGGEVGGAAVAPDSSNPAASEARREADRLRRELAALRQRADDLARRQAMEERLRREAEENVRQQEERQEDERRRQMPVTRPVTRREFPALRAGTVAWSGVIDGAAEVLLTGNSATLRPLAGNQPTDVRVSFSATLPHAAMRVALVSTDGRGEITIVQPPALENGYTTIVRLDDRRKSGEKRYQFTLRWELEENR